MSRFLDARFSSLKPYTPGEQPRGRSYIKLNTNECPYPPSPKVLEAVNADALNDLRLYSDPTARALTDAIAAAYGVGGDQVFAGNGSDEVLAFAFQAFCGERGVVMPEISYGFYPVFAELYGICARKIPLRADFTIDPAQYLMPGENVVIANPNAPTGLALTLDQIEMILRAHPDDVVLIDEAYVDFGAESAVKLLDRYDNLLVVQTFSKSRALAGGRLGFALGSPALIADLNTIKFSFHPYNCDRLIQAIGIASVQDAEYMRACTGRIIATREMCKAELRDMGCDVTDSLGNFLFVRLPGFAGGDAYRALRERGILVRWFDVESIRDWLRITVGSEEEMQILLGTVRDLLNR